MKIPREAAFEGFMREIGERTWRLLHLFWPGLMAAPGPHALPSLGGQAVSPLVRTSSQAQETPACQTWPWSVLLLAVLSQSPGSWSDALSLGPPVPEPEAPGQMCYPSGSPQHGGGGEGRDVGRDESGTWGCCVGGGPAL